MDKPPSLPPKGTSEDHQQQQPYEQPERPVIPLPKAFDVLPTREITKLLDTLDVLKGYLMTLTKDQIDSDINEINAIIHQIQQFSQRINELESQKQQTNTRLTHLHQLVNQWQSEEEQMHRSLQKFQREKIYNQLQGSVNESIRLTQSIQDSFLNHTGKYEDEASIQAFVRSYRQERKLFHLRKEKLDRFNENRVGGLS